MMKRFLIWLLAIVAMSTSAAIREESSQFQYTGLVAFSNHVMIGYYDATNSVFNSADFPVTFGVFGTDGVILPTGTTAQQPSGYAGYSILRYNVDSGGFEYNYNDSGWYTLATTNSTVYLQSQISSNDTDIVNLNNATNSLNTRVGANETSIIAKLDTANFSLYTGASELRFEDLEGYTNFTADAFSWGDHSTAGYASTGEVAAVSNIAETAIQPYDATYTQTVALAAEVPLKLDAINGVADNLYVTNNSMINFGFSGQARMGYFDGDKKTSLYALEDGGLDLIALSASPTSDVTITSASGDINLNATTGQINIVAPSITLFSGTNAVARFVTLTNGIALEVWQASTSNWIPQVEWVEY